MLKSPSLLGGGSEAEKDQIETAKMERVKSESMRYDTKIDAPTNTNGPTVAAATTSLTLPFKAASPTVSASQQRARGTKTTVKQEEGREVANAGSDGPSRPAFSGQDWRLLEPELMPFCFKVLHEDGAERAR